MWVAVQHREYRPSAIHHAPLRPLPTAQRTQLGFGLLNRLLWRTDSQRISLESSVSQAEPLSRGAVTESLSLRAVLSSLVTKTAPRWHAILRDTNEMGSFVARFDMLHTHYNALHEIVASVV